MTDRESELRKLMQGGEAPVQRPCASDEQIWDTICKLCAEDRGVSPERAKAILADHGYHANAATRLVDALAIVQEAVPLVYPSSIA